MSNFLFYGQTFGGIELVEDEGVILDLKAVIEDEDVLFKSHCEEYLIIELSCFSSLALLGPLKY